MSSCDYTLPPISITPCDDGKAFFISQLKKADFATLKGMLEKYEDAEEYEFCRLIQNEIDSRVNA